MKVLLIGGSSFIGFHFLKKYAGCFSLTATYYSHPIEISGIKTLPVDIADKESCRALFASTLPHVVVLCSAVSSLDNPEQSGRVNVEGTSVISSLCREFGSRLIFLSSDCVFSGKDGPYAEDALPSPIQQYGWTKQEGERIVRHVENHALLRTSLVYGWPEPFQHGNVVTSLLSSKEPFIAHTDMYRTPSYVGDVADALKNIIDSGATGIFHAASPDYVTMDKFAQSISRVFSLPVGKVSGQPAPADTNRPRRAGLLASRTEEQLNIRFKTVEEGLSQMKNDRSPQLALVTGGAGFIGSHLVEALAEKGFKVRVLDSLVKGKLASIQHLIQQGKVEFVEGDIRNKDCVDTAMKGVEYVFHTAGIHIEKSVVSPDDCIGNNIQGSYNVFKSALDHGVKRVIFSSSSSAYGNPAKLPMAEGDHPLPVEPYGASKLFCEHLLQHLAKNGLHYNALRYFNVYGERQAVHAYYTTVVIHFIKRIMNSEPPMIDGKGDQSMDFTHVSDVVRANLLAMESDAVNEVFNVGTGKSTSVAQLADIIIRALGKNIQPIFRERDVFVTRRQADISKAERMLGFRAEKDVETGISEVARDIAGNTHLY